MKKRSIYSSLALVALLAPTLSATTVFVPAMMPVVPAMSPVAPVMSTTETQDTGIQVVSNQQPAFTNTGTPTYPILGNTTIYTAPVTPVIAAQPVSLYTSNNVAQQIVTNYQSSLQSQTDNLYNPVSYGAYGSSYGYGYNPYTANSTYGLGSSPATFAMTPVVAGGQQQVLWQQVVLITNNNSSASTTLPNGFFDPAASAPEPGTLLLLAAGLGTLAVVARRKQKKA